MVMKMKKQPIYILAKFIVDNRKKINIVFILAVIICGIMFPFVGVNYDLSQYLPSFAPTKQALDVMEEEFGYPGMARIMLKDTTKYEAKQIRDQISDIDGVDMVIGDDLLENIYAAPGFMKTEMSDDFFKDGNAIIEVVFEEGDSDPKTKAALDEIYDIVGYEDNVFSGSAVSSKFRQESITKEIVSAIFLSLVIIFIILAITTTSWFEPLLFIAVMVVAIILNMGSNIIFGTISFFTFSTAAILQLAVSMDYSIFLLHTFSAYEERGIKRETAMILAICKSCKSILASGATTIVGFITIALMQFTIGKDVGFVLTKGIICSLLTVIFMMPSLILTNTERIKKYKHKAFIPPFTRLGSILRRFRRPILIICILLAVPCYIGQGMNKFYYGDDALGASPGTKYYEDTREINNIFGKSNMVIAMVPNTSLVQEREVTDAINDLDFVNYAISLGGALPEGIPVDFLPDDIVDIMHTDNYARILISMNNMEESDYSFECNDILTKTVESYYPEDSHVLGMTATTIDIKNILTEDYNKVSIISMIGVAIVVAITFKSFLIPLFVIIPIEVAIYFNMTLPYIAGGSLLYICYIIVSCLQLGATIDYSILVANNYFDERHSHNKEEAAINAVNKSAISVLTSGLILAVVGYLLFFTSSITAISQVGHLVGRGALLSMLLVLTLLPALLSAVDEFIMKRREAQKLKKQEKANKNKKLLPAIIPEKIKEIGKKADKEKNKGDDKSEK